MVDDNMLSFVREFIDSHDPIGTKLGRRFPFRRLYDHCYRCYRWAQRLNAIEGGDPEVTQISALFHDVGKCVDDTLAGHAEAGARLCREYLDGIGFDTDKRDRIVRTVRLHVQHGRGEESSLEAKIESDADLLDEVGAMTVLWDCMAAGAEAEQTYEIAYQRIRDAHRKLKGRPGETFHTPSGRRFYQERCSFLGRIVRNLEFELGIEDAVTEDTRPGDSGGDSRRD